MGSILGRILSALLTLWLCCTAVFFAVQVLPGDTASIILGSDATPDSLAALREQLGLTGSLPERYLRWLGDLVSGDFGTSLANQQPVWDFLSVRILNSLILMILAAIVAFPLAIALGVMSANWRGSKFDGFVSISTLAVAAVPEFVIGILLVLLLSTSVLKLLPAVSYAPPGTATWSEPASLVLPVLTLALAISPHTIRMMRAVMIDILQSDYIELGRLKGLSTRGLLMRHALPNAIGPTVQVIALSLAWMAGGVVVIEYVFSYPGIGTALVDAVNFRDVPVIQTLTFAIAAIYVVVNLCADAVLYLTSPRARTAAA